MVINKYFSIYFLVLFLIIVLDGCTASSNFYSARTLEENKFAVSFGADDIVTKSSGSSSENIGISKDLPFAPSVGIFYGLPYRLETGLRWYPIRFLEGSLREQLNPRSFNTFDASINLSYAGLIGVYSYLKYGATISKNINEFEPFIYYSFYHTMGNMTGLTGSSGLDGFITNLSSDIINNSRTIGFGIGLPLGKTKFYPEVDYDYYENNITNGIWHFGVGLRLYTN